MAENSTLFVDSGAFIALFALNDRYHRQAAEFYRKCTSRTKVTTNLVVAETYTWLRYKASYEAAAAFATGVKEAEERGFLTIIRATKELESETLQILERFKTESLSFVDGLSFVVIATINIKEVFGFDSHFFVLGCNLVPGDDGRTR